MATDGNTNAGQTNLSGDGIRAPVMLLFLVWALFGKGTALAAQSQVEQFKITILSTMLVGDTAGTGNGALPPSPRQMATGCSWIRGHIRIR